LREDRKRDRGDGRKKIIREKSTPFVGPKKLKNPHYVLAFTGGGGGGGGGVVGGGGGGGGGGLNPSKFPATGHYAKRYGRDLTYEKKQK